MGIVVGLAGGPNYSLSSPAIPGLSPLFFHDAAAALSIDGVLQCAIEEERVSRAKHTNLFPAGALQAVLAQGAISPQQVDTFAFFFSERFCNDDLAREYRERGMQPLSDARTLLTRYISRALDFECPPARLQFVRHHDTHCLATLAGSGFPRALVAVIDGNGEYESTSIYWCDQRLHELLATYPISASLGRFYRLITELLGFGNFDEYKVMGLAPYGSSEQFLPQFRRLYTPGERGAFTLDIPGVKRIAEQIGLSAQRDGNVSAEQANFAAAAQALLEQIAMDLLTYWQRQTGATHLCLAGGVAQNCVMTGKVAAANLFEAIYVHPASHDAGAAIGAALVAGGWPAVSTVGQRFTPLIGRGALAPDAGDLESTLNKWRAVLKFSKPADLHRLLAEAIAGGAVIGWVQGLAEFGPRALGARSILADPRPEENRTRINAIIKKRETFRPFAPAVLEEYVSEYFKLPRTRCNLEEMVFVVPVREHHKATLGAITHVDGSARIQVVTSQRNPGFWQLIEEFRRVTGVAVLLNTSFNNQHEPIVDSLHDAIRTFLTTDLDYLVVGDHLISKVMPLQAALPSARAALWPEAQLERRRAAGAGWTLVKASHKRELSSELAGWLQSASPTAEIASLLQGAPDGSELLMELQRLWEERLIDITW